MKSFCAVCATVAMFATATFVSQSSRAQERTQNVDRTSRAFRAQESRAMAERFIRAGDPASAMGYLRDAINAHPQDPRAYLLLGKIYADREEWEEATLVYERGSMMCPGETEILEAYARLLEQRGDLRGALRLMRTVVSLEPQSATAHLERARLAQALGAWSEALAALRRVKTFELEAEQVASVERTIAALEILTRHVDPLRSPYACTDSRLRRVLGRCERE